MKRFLLLFFLFIGTCYATLTIKWNFPMMGRYSDRMIYGSSPALADLGPDVNSVGGERTDFIEIIVGSDEVRSPYSSEHGAWRCIDALGNLEWYLLTLTDEARSSPAIDDFWGNNGLGDNLKDIAAGTTSGWSVEAFSHTGNFFWRFGTMTGPGNFLWHSSPAIADVFPATQGKEIIIGNSNSSCQAVYCLEGDITDYVDNAYIGYSGTEHPGCWSDPVGIDGTDWDLLWFYNTNGPIVSTPAVGDIDNDGVQEIIIGTGYEETPYWTPSGLLGYDGKILCLNGSDGTREWEIQTGGGFYSQVPASAALSDVDGDGDSEIFIGACDSLFYCIDGDENSSGTIEFWELATVSLGGPIYSSAAIGDVDADGIKEIIVGGGDGKIYCLRYNPAGDNVVIEWQTQISPYIIFSSPALCAQNDSLPWLQFRHNSKRTAHYPITGQVLHIFVGTWDGYLVHILGNGTEVERIKLGEKIVTSPAIADIDKDCKLEVVIVTARGIFPPPGWSYSLDTLWCVGTEILSGIPSCCDTFPTWIVCPYPCNIFTSCGDQVMIFGIGDIPSDRVDTMRVFVSYSIMHSGGGVSSGTLREPTPHMSFQVFPPNSLYVIITPPTGVYIDGDVVQITLDSLFSISGCKTVP